MSVSVMDYLTRPTAKKMLLTLMGEAGVGKTRTVASMGNAVCYLPIEDGLESVAHLDNVLNFQVPRSYDEVVSCIELLINDDNARFDVFCIDSISALDVMICDEVLAQDAIEAISKKRKPAQTVNQAFGGYGNGAEMVSRKHAKIRDLCERLRTEKNMTVVFIGHAQSKVNERPDELEAYSYLELKITNKAKYHYVDNVDMVGYMKVDSMIQPSDNKDKVSKITTLNTRSIVCRSNLAYVTKNRYGIEQDIPVVLGENPFAFLNK